MNNKKYCTKCGTENDANYYFCRSCGARLTAPAVSPTEGAPVAPVIREERKAYASDDMTFGIPTEAVAEFVGENSDTVINNFKKQEATGKKVSFNLPAFLFGVLGGLPFVYFFYRKMYKAAALLLAVSVILAGIMAVPLVKFMDEYADVLIDQFKKYDGDDFDLDYDFDFADYDISDSLPSEAELSLTLKYDAIFSLFSVVRVVLGLIFALRANSMYASHTVKKLNALGTEYPNGVPKVAISDAGGVSKKSAILSSVLYMVFNVIVAFASVAVLLVKFISAMW